jgi:hypothetical protein
MGENHRMIFLYNFKITFIGRSNLFLMFEQHREYILPYIYIYIYIYIYNVVIYYLCDTSFHGWSPYVIFIWKTHHCNNIFIYNIISYEKPTWYQSGTRIKSLGGGPKKIREIAWCGPSSNGVTRYICTEG